MPAERPDVLTAKVNRLIEVVADADDLKHQDESQLSSTTGIDDVGAAQREALEDLAEADGSVAEVESVLLPSDRL